MQYHHVYLSQNKNTMDLVLTTMAHNWRSAALKWHKSKANFQTYCFCQVRQQIKWLGDEAIFYFITAERISLSFLIYLNCVKILTNEQRLIIPLLIIIMYFNTNNNKYYKLLSCILNTYYQLIYMALCVHLTCILMRIRQVIKQQF